MINKKWPDFIILNPNQRQRFEKSVQKSGFKIFYTLTKRSEFGVFMLMENGKWMCGKTHTKETNY